MSYQKDAAAVGAAADVAVAALTDKVAADAVTIAALQAQVAALTPVAPVPVPTPTPTPTPAPVPVPAKPVDPPVGDLPGWHLIFADNFTKDCAEGEFLSTYPNWRAYPNTYKDTSKNGTYEPNIISVHEGLMDMHVRTEGGKHLVAAPQPRINGASGARGQLYGRYSVRFRCPVPLPGYKVAWLLWPDSNASAEGEIDFPEGNLGGGTIGAYSHDVNGTHSHNAFGADTHKSFTDWHVATVEWLPSGVTFYLDGAKLGTSSQLGTPKTPMHWILQTETALSGAAPAANVSGHVLVDWVAVWKKA